MMAKKRMNQKRNINVHSGPVMTAQPQVASVKSTGASQNPARSSKVNLAAPETTLTHEQIAERAWCIWQNRGCSPGEDERNWLEAEAQLKAEFSID